MLIQLLYKIKTHKSYFSLKYQTSTIKRSNLMLRELTKKKAINSTRFLQGYLLTRLRLINKMNLCYTYHRSDRILQAMKGYQIAVHKGSRFNKIHIYSWQLTHRLGEFSFTRKPFIFIKKEKKQTKKR